MLCFLTGILTGAHACTMWLIPIGSDGLLPIVHCIDYLLVEVLL